MTRKLRAKSPAVEHNQAGATKMAEAVPQHRTLYNTHYILRAKSPTCDDNRRYTTATDRRHWSYKSQGRLRAQHAARTNTSN